MGSAEAGSRIRAVPETARTAHLASVTSANFRRTPATRRAFAMHRGAFAAGCRALAMISLSILRMHRCLARPVSVAHEPAQV